ncbi:MAG: hypothetical protein IKZ87_03095 [Actinomycetaceae bacterium]|nr:hypothetical protein [Actinomycetaceae bacterium]
MINSLIGEYSSDAVAQMAVEWAHKASTKQLTEEDVHLINAIIDVESGGYVTDPTLSHKINTVIDILHDEGPRASTLCEQLGRDQGEWHEIVSDAKAELADDVRSTREMFIQQSMESEIDFRRGAFAEMVLASASDPALEAKVLERATQLNQVTNLQQSEVGMEQTASNAHVKHQDYAEGEVAPPDPPDDVPERNSGPSMP